MAETKIVEGIVESVSSNTGTSKKGGTWTSKSFKIDGEWYGGFLDADNKAKVTGASEGDTIKLRVEKNAKGYWNYTKDFKVVKTGEKVSSPSGSGTTSLAGFTREYGMAIGKASGVVQGLCASGAIKTPEKATTALLALGKVIMEEVWLATPDTLGFTETESIEPPVEKEADNENDGFDED